jgi:hypothetical protein
MPYAVPKTPFCNLNGNDKFFYPDFAKGSNFPADLLGNCPLQPVTETIVNSSLHNSPQIFLLFFIQGNYTLRNVQIQLKNLPKMILPSGDYCAETVYFNGTEKIAIYRIYVTVNQI